MKTGPDHDSGHLSLPCTCRRCVVLAMRHVEAVLDEWMDCDDALTETEQWPWREWLIDAYDSIDEDDDRAARRTALVSAVLLYFGGLC